MRYLVLPFLLVLGLAVAGCGGGGSPSVASIGSSRATTANSDSAAPSSGGGPSSGGTGLSLTMKAANGAKFAECMRKNGVPNFPDPSANGSITINSSNGVNPSSPKFRAANEKCRKLLPNGGQPTAHQQAEVQQRMLAFARCMRAHGLKDFPDPTFTNGGGSMQLKGGPGTDLNPTSPLFQRAQSACKSYLPGTGKGGISTSGGAGG
jgi:hypothetical protein